MTSGQPVLTFNDFSVNPRQSWPCFSRGLKKCKFILPYMSFVQKWPLCSEPFQKSHCFSSLQRREKQKRESQTPFNTLQKGLGRQKLKWGIMQNTSQTLFLNSFFMFFFLFCSVLFCWNIRFSIGEWEDVNSWILVTSPGQSWWKAGHP